MKVNPSTPVLAAFAAIALFAAGCNTPAKETPETAKPDMAAIKAEIQAIETDYAKAFTKKDFEKAAAVYADDAIVMNDDAPMHVGKAAIRDVLRSEIAASKPGTTASFTTLDVLGDGNLITEVGKTTFTDAAGKVFSSGKYMCVFEKRDGKYVCLRDINNQDQKTK